MSTRIWLLSTLLILFAGCTPSSQPAYSSQVDIVINASELSEVRWHVPSGEDVQLQLNNQTSEIQVLSILTPAGSRSSGEPWFNIDILPGVSIQTTFIAPAAPGEYDVVIEGAHTNTRLHAEIIVVQPWE